MTTQRPLRIITDAAPAIVERLRAAGHSVERVTVIGGPAICNASDDIDLIIAANAWHLPVNAPNADAHVDHAVAWMQRRLYATKPKQRRAPGPTPRKRT
jgi:hypothetical protein